MSYLDLVNPFVNRANLLGCIFYGSLPNNSSLVIKVNSVLGHEAVDFNMDEINNINTLEIFIPGNTKNINEIGNLLIEYKVKLIDSYLFNEGSVFKYEIQFSPEVKFLLRVFIGRRYPCIFLEDIYSGRDMSVHDCSYVLRSIQNKTLYLANDTFIHTERERIIECIRNGYIIVTLDDRIIMSEDSCFLR